MKNIFILLISVDICLAVTCERLEESSPLPQLLTHSHGVLYGPVLHGDQQSPCEPQMNMMKRIVLGFSPCHSVEQTGTF